MYQRPHRRSPAAADKSYTFRRMAQTVAVEPLLAQLDALPDDAWLRSQWKWHLGTRFCIVRGGESTGVPGDRLTSGGGVDAPVLARLPAVRHVLQTAFPVPVTLAWIGASPPGARICAHVDNTAHWDEHHRIHLPLRTNPAAKLCVAGRWLHLPAGTLWALNNSVAHAAANDGPIRLHLMVDLPDVPAVRTWLATGEDVAGHADDALWADVNRSPMDGLTPERLGEPGLLQRLLQQ